MKKEDTIDIYECPEKPDLRYMVAVMQHVLDHPDAVVEMVSDTFPEPWVARLTQRWCWGLNGTRYRIRRPKIAEGHNPDGLTEEQVGVKDGWRLLSEAEASGQRRFCDTQYWRLDGWSGLGAWWSFLESETLRTQKPPGYFLTKEPEYVPWTQADVPAICWVRTNAGDFLVTRVNETGICYGAHKAAEGELEDPFYHTTFEALAKNSEILHSTDRKTWKLCRREVNKATVKLVWVDPFTGIDKSGEKVTGTIEQHATVQDCINFARAANKHHPKAKDATDEDLLWDFIAINWVGKSDIEEQRWRCKRCEREVDMKAFKCGCTQSPSPWELISP